MLSKPIYARFIVLELSKYLMYDFHYGFIKKHFDAGLLSTDTDCLTYEIKYEDVYDNFFKNKSVHKLAQIVLIIYRSSKLTG